VQDVLINEGITACRVIFYLALAVRGERALVLPFRHLFPRLPVLREVAAGIRRVL
jgi:GPI-GlcNAc transferase complex PIG-H subunit